MKSKLINIYNPHAKSTIRFFRNINDSISNRQAHKIAIDAKLRRGSFAKKYRKE